ncbi:MAG: protein-glutamate O-methyltransferase CheR [Flavobacteriales bacterium]|nr:protein-glutamate O-methyltransferase CheR [Flavobacteriales bacterium]
MINKLEYMLDSDFRKLSNLIFNDYGIKMPMSKKVMLESRLRKRLKANNMTTFNEYCKFVFSDEGIRNELVHMIDVVSTNKTDFFREPLHFEYMSEFLLPRHLNKPRREPLRIWSSAASTGEEAYTIAITIEEFLQKEKLFDYSIHCTDISTRVIEKAVDGIYDLERVGRIPMEIKKKYFLKNKDPEKPMVRVVPALRRKLTFNRLNLIDDVYKVPHDFDLIFCRNVLIYFDKPTQERVINKLCMKLKPGGIFLLGHSESVSGINVPLRAIKPTIYERI